MLPPIPIAWSNIVVEAPKVDVSKITHGPGTVLTERMIAEMTGRALPERIPGPMNIGSTENGSMAVTTPLPTETALRGQAGFTFPEELRGIAPLLLIFGLVLLILLKR